MPSLARLLSLALLLAMLTSCTSSPIKRSHGEFLAREVTVAGTAHRYQVFVPASPKNGAKPPVILFLHGSGERGDDGIKPTLVGLGPYVRAHASDFPAIVVFPQAPEDSEWPRDAGPLALAALDQSLREFDGDPKRVVLTGLSMGGYGTWEIALRQPQRFAAVIPVCGGITVDWKKDRQDMQALSVLDAIDPFAEAAHRLRDVPIWIFHGARDDVVPPEQSRRMAAALRAAGARDVRYTEFRDANHNAWDAAYSMPGLWEWALAAD